MRADRFGVEAMMRLLPSYTAVKDSGARWLGAVPESWIVMRSKRLFVPRTELARTNDIQLSATQAYGVIPQADFERAVGRKVTRVLQHLEKRRHVEVDDFVISMRSFQGGLERAWASGCIRSSYVVLRPAAPLVVGYYTYVFKSHGYIRALQSTASFIRDGQDLNFANFCEVDLPCPPLSEQNAIARFLGHADRRIRRYIRAKQRLIKLIEEQKQAIIYGAVTRGLDPNVRVKPSGVEWLGEVPEHWEIRRARSCVSDTRAGVWGDDPIPQNAADHITCVRVADFDMRQLRVSPARLTVRAVPEPARRPRTLSPGDVLMEKSGGGESQPVGRVVLYDGTVAERAITSNFITRLRPDPSLVVPEFLLLVLAAMQATRRNVPFIKQTTGIQNLDERAYLSQAVALPPKEAQQTLLAELRSLLLPLERAVERCGREVALVREYRTTLVADVVTGKVDVREAAARLPADAEETEPEDVESEVEPEEANEALDEVSAEADA